MLAINFAFGAIAPVASNVLGYESVAYASSVEDAYRQFAKDGDIQSYKQALSWVSISEYKPEMDIFANNVRAAAPAVGDSNMSFTPITKQRRYDTKSTPYYPNQYDINVDPGFDRTDKLGLNGVYTGLVMENHKELFFVGVNILSKDGSSRTYFSDNIYDKDFYSYNFRGKNVFMDVTNVDFKGYKLQPGDVITVGYHFFVNNKVITEYNRIDSSTSSNGSSFNIYNKNIFGNLEVARSMNSTYFIPEAGHTGSVSRSGQSLAQLDGGSENTIDYTRFKYLNNFGTTPLSATDSQISNKLSFMNGGKDYISDVNLLINNKSVKKSADNSYILQKGDIVTVFRPTDSSKGGSSMPVNYLTVDQADAKRTFIDQPEIVVNDPTYKIGGKEQKDNGYPKTVDNPVIEVREKEVIKEVVKEVVKNPEVPKDFKAQTAVVTFEKLADAGLGDKVDAKKFITNLPSDYKSASWVSKPDTSKVSTTEKTAKMKVVFANGSSKDYDVKYKVSELAKARPDLSGLNKEQKDLYSDVIFLLKGSKLNAEDGIKIPGLKEKPGYDSKVEEAGK